MNQGRFQGRNFQPSYSPKYRDQYQKYNIDQTTSSMLRYSDGNNSVGFNKNIQNTKEENKITNFANFNSTASVYTKIEGNQNAKEQPEDLNESLPIKKKPNTHKSPFYPHFILCGVPLDCSNSQLITNIQRELRNYGDIVRLEFKNKTENLTDITLSFACDKDAVLALKSPIHLKVGHCQNSKSIQLLPTHEFKKYLTDLSSVLKLQSNQSINTQSPELKPEVKSEISIKPTNQSNQESAKKERSPTQVEKENKKIIILGSRKKKEVPLEIKKPENSTKSGSNSSYSENSESKKLSLSRKPSKKIRSRSRSSSRNRKDRRHTKRTHDRDDHHKSRSRRTERLLRKDHHKDRSRRSSNRRSRSSSREKHYKEKRKYRESNSEDRRLKRDSFPIVRTINLATKGSAGKVSNTRMEDDSWKEDEDNCELTCYAIGIPLECDFSYMKELLEKEGYSGQTKMQWRDFEGLDYLKLVFENKVEAQRFLSQQIFVHEIPVIIIPKLPKKTPLELLVHHQLRVQSLSGPVQSKSVYEFLLKFGFITDFLVLDSLDHPTTFIVTFTSHASKRLLAGYYPDNIAILSENNYEKKLQFELNIKPALVVRKRLNQTIIHQYKEAQNRCQERAKINPDDEEPLNLLTPPLTMSTQSSLGSIPQNLISPIPSFGSGFFNFSPTACFTPNNAVCMESVDRFFSGSKQNDLSIDPKRSPLPLNQKFQFTSPPKINLNLLNFSPKPGPHNPLENSPLTIPDTWLPGVQKVDPYGMHNPSMENRNNASNFRPTFYPNPSVENVGFNKPVRVNSELKFEDFFQNVQSWK